MLGRWQDDGRVLIAASREVTIVRFSQREIELAVQLKDDGLAWTPAVGHYVYDQSGAVNAPSPFQDGVYYILNYDHFMRLLGGAPRFQELMVWLPSWHDARHILRLLDVSNDTIREVLLRDAAIENGTELLVLYELIHRGLQAKNRGNAVALSSRTLRRN
jgi:hypothetical protein